MSYKSSNGKTSASCSGEIDTEYKTIDLRNPKHIARLAELSKCEAKEVKPVHAFFWGVFRGMKRVILPSGATIWKTRSKGGLFQFRMGKFLFIEQNIKTGSWYAKQAKAGAHIMWVIDVEASNNTYVARVIEGRVKKL